MNFRKNKYKNCNILFCCYQQLLLKKTIMKTDKKEMDDLKKRYHLYNNLPINSILINPITILNLNRKGVLSIIKIKQRVTNLIINN